MSPAHDAAAPKSTVVTRMLDAIERVGNRLPDPAVLFLLLMLAVWAVSALLSGVQFSEIDPRTVNAENPGGTPIQVVNLLSGTSLTGFMAQMVQTFVTFPPLGVVLVAMLGLGVAEHTGFISAGLRSLLAFTPRSLLTPMLIAVGILSHVAVDAGYVLVIPLGAVIFYAAGRHPLAGIAAAFAGVSGGFSATMFVPSSLDPLLAQVVEDRQENPPHRQGEERREHARQDRDLHDAVAGGQPLRRRIHRREHEHRHRHIDDAEQRLAAKCGGGGHGACLC